MAYERLDIEVTDGGSSRRVQRSLEDLGRTGKKSAQDIAQEMARMATSGSNSLRTFSGTLQELQRQLGATSKAGLLSSSAMATIGQSALAAARPVAVLGTVLTLYGSAATGSSRASLLSSSAMGTVAGAAIAATRPVVLLTLAMNANAAAAVRMTQANLFASTAMRTVSGAQAQAALPTPPQRLLLTGPSGSAGAAGAAGAAAGASNLNSILQRLQATVGNVRNTLSGLWGSIRNGASSAGAAVAGMFSRFGGGGGGGGGGAAGAAAAAAAGGLNQIEAAAKRASSALITMNTLMYSLQIGLIAVLAVRFADEWQSINNKLGLVTSSTQELSAANEVLFQVAQRTRSAYSDVVELFQSLRLQAENLGLSMKATAELTETISMASQIGSRGPAQAGAGVLQLTQALALGRLSGQNLNSVLQSTPRIAIAIAQGLGVTTAALRQLAEDGKLTADVIVKALQGQAPKIAEEFLRLKPTISGAFTVLTNGAIEFIGRVDETTGFASSLAEGIITLAKNMDILAFAITAVGSALMVAFGGAVQRAIFATGAAIAANPIGAFAALVLATVAAVVLLRDRMSEYPELFAALAGGVAVLAAMLIGPMVTSLMAVVSATWAWTVALLANPFTWVALAIGAVVAAIVYFGNKTYEVNGKTISGWSYLRAVAAGTWAAIIAGVKSLWENIRTYFTNIAKALGALGMAFFSVVKGDFAGAKKWADMAWSSAGAAVGVWTQVGAAMGSAYTDAFNASVAEAPVATPKKKGATATLSDVPGVPVPYGTKDKASSDGRSEGRKLTRAEMIQEEMRRIQDETVTAANLTYTYLDRAAYEAIDKFNEGLRKRKDEKGNQFALLSPAEEQAMLRALLGLEEAKRLQQARDEVMREAIGPRLKYLETEQAIGQLLGQNQISAQEAQRAYLDAQIAYYQTREDRQSGRVLGRLQIMRELRDEAGRVSSAMVNIWKEQVGPMLDYAAQLDAIQALEEQRLITSQQAAAAARSAAISYLDSQRDAASGVTRALLKIQQAAEDTASQMETLITNAFQNLEDIWVSITKGEKVSVKALFEGLQEDIARAAFQQYVAGPLAGFLQSRFGLDVPGLKGKLGESRQNPMWVKNADLLPTGGAQGAGANDPIGGLLNLLGLGSKMDSGSWVIDEMGATFDDFLADFDRTFGEGNQAFGSQFAAGVGALGTVIGGLIGGKAGGIIGSIAQGFSLVAPYLGFATGGSFTVGQHAGNFASGGSFMVAGSGGVDSQLVSFRASPGERVSIERAGQVAADRSSGPGGDTYNVTVDARGADASVDRKIEAAIRNALPEAVRRARQGANADRVYAGSRQQLSNR